MSPIVRPLALAGLTLLCAPMAIAETGLLGHEVLFRVETWDTPDTVIFVTRDYIATVAPAPEFAVAPEAANGMVAVPVKVDIAADRIDLSYAQTPPGGFSVATFNGYVLTFLSECVLFTGATLDPEVTTLPLTDKDLTIDGTVLRINVSGLQRDENSHIGVLLDVTDCPLG